ncbi:MAG: GNAT family N-acetyltransferase [Actinomycetota bacterium]
MASEIDVRPTLPHEYRAACDTMRAALLTGSVNDEEFARSLVSWEQSLSISAWHDDRCVGHAGALRVDTVVPGGATLNTAGITRVGVLPTHTRQGILSRMMHRLLHDARGEGAGVASLRASQSVIYGRFGFGMAGQAVTADIDPVRARPLPTTVAGSVRLVRPDEFFDVVPTLYLRMPQRPGGISRHEHLWNRYFDGFLRGTKSEFVVVHSDPDGVDDGYAHYALKWDESDGIDGGTGEVFDVFGRTPAVEVALWDYLTAIDLVHKWHVECRPIDDTLSVAAHDLRSYAVTQRWDEQWVRLLDVEQALRVRTYRSDATVSLRVTDAMFPDNDGIYLVSADGLSRSSSGDAELTVDVGTLSAAYLGTTTWYSLATIGRVEGTPDAVDRADLLFGHRPSSFCGSYF